MPVGELPRPGDGSLVDEGALSPRRIGRASLRRQLADQQTNNPGEEALDEQPEQRPSAAPTTLDRK